MKLKKYLWMDKWESRDFLRLKVMPQWRQGKDCAKSPALAVEIATSHSVAKSLKSLVVLSGSGDDGFSTASPTRSSGLCFCEEVAITLTCNRRM